jgi:hypothetical protein
MKRFYTALLFTLSIVTANAQSFDREFSTFSDSTTFANNGTAVDFTRSMPDLGYLVINCLPKGDPWSFLQLWFPSLTIQANPYIMTCVSSDAPVDLTITASYPASSGGGSAVFGKYSLKGGGEFDTAFYRSIVTKPIEQLMMNVSAQPCLLTFDWFRMGELAHPIQAKINLTPKIMPEQTDTIKLSKVSYYFEKGNPIPKLICTAKSTSTSIDKNGKSSPDFTIVDNPDDTSFLVIFKTLGIVKNTIAFITITVEDVGSNYTRTFDIAATITHSAGIDEPVNSEFNIYPVPVQNTLTVELPDDGGYQLSVIDGAGKVVLSQVVMKGINKVDLNTASLASGAYALVIGNGRSIESKKFTK